MIFPSEYIARGVRACGLLAKYQGDNWFDEQYHDFEGRLEKGLIPHVGIPGWFLIRTYCTDCDEPCTAIRYHCRRMLLVPSGTTQMGKFWVIHQCPHPYDIGPEEGQIEPDEIDAQERADIEQELLNQQWPDDPCVRDGDGNIRYGGFDDE